MTGKVVIITGAARGQGRSHALRLAAEGASVALLDSCSTFTTTGYEPSTVAELKATTDDVRALNAQVLSFECDVRDSAALDAAVAAVMAEWGRLDVIVANAGISSFAPFLQLTDEQWDEMIDVNLTGTFRTLRSALPAMVEAGNGGSVVIVGSTASIKGAAFNAHYVASKHGVAGLMRTIAIEFAGHNIRANVVGPGSVNTVMGNDPAIQEIAADPELLPLLVGSFRPLMDPGTIEAEDITDTVLFLASAASRRITGQVFAVDAGVTAW